MYDMIPGVASGWFFQSLRGRFRDYGLALRELQAICVRVLVGNLWWY